MHDADSVDLVGDVARQLTLVLQAHFKWPVKIVMTNNRRRLVSYQKRQGRLEVRVARRLAALGGLVVEPVVAFVREQPHGRAALRTLFEAVPDVPTVRRGPGPMQSQGDTFDLAEILARESWSGFGEPCEVPITWGARRRPRRGQRSIRLGTYDFEHGYIRIHRRLDQPQVPEWFVGFVVFHELLHHRLGVSMRGKRRVIHSAEFRALEASHPRYLEAQQWERKALPDLLRSRGRWGKGGRR
jgi:hypothetical protein